MKKLLKKLTVTGMAVIMAMGMAVSASASDCLHPMTIRSRTGVATQYYSSHTITVYAANGTSHNESCTISNVIYYISYVCTVCHQIAYSAGTETVENHLNINCSQY